MTDNQHSSPNEARVAALVRATGVDEPPPDAALLAQLRERSLAALEEEGGAGVSPAVTKQEVAGRQAGSLPYGRSLMFRALIALAAVVVIGVFAFNPWTTTPVSGAPFSQVLKNLRDAQSLRLQVQRDNQQAQVWIRRPGLVRWEESD